MSKLIKFCVLLVFYYGTCMCAILDDNTELELAFLVHRHGERTPLEQSITYATDEKKVLELSKPYGFGQLTNAGIERAYELGKFIRDRYNKVLSPWYNRSEIYIRSTDSTRTKMSILAVMAAVYQPNARAWNPRLNWTPVPYTTVPAETDFNLASLNCRPYLDYYKKAKINNTVEMAEYADVFEDLYKIGYDFRKTPLKVVDAYDTFLAQLGLGVPLDPKVAEMLPRIQKAAYKGWDILIGNDKYLDIEAGVLLNSFFEFADKVIAGKPTQKVRILSGHDFNVYSFLAVTQAEPRPGIPKYGALFCLELRKISKTGDYIVVPYYESQPGEKVQYLHVKGCNKQCTYEKFRQITAKYLLTELEWRDKCHVTDNGENALAVVE